MKQQSLAKILLLGVLALTLISCGSSRKKELEPVELEDFQEQVEIDKIWSRSIGSGLGEYYHQYLMAVDRDYLYAAAEDGKVYQLDKLTGDKRWKVSLDTELTSGVAIDNQHVYVAALDGNIIALSKETGEQVWTQQLRSELVTPPTVQSNHLIAQLSNGEIYNLNAQNGEIRWRYDSSVPALTLRGNSRAAFFSDIALTGLANGKLVLLDVNTGQLRGDPRVAIAQGDSEIERIVDVDSTPVFLDGKIYTVSYQGRIIALDVQTGRMAWVHEESSYRDIAIGFSNVYVSSADGAVIAYDKKQGDIKWAQEGLLRRKLTAPSVVSSYVLVADFEGYLHLLSQISGEFAARTKVSGSGVKSNILVDENRFYVLANNGKLKAYQLGEAITD